MKTSIYFIQQFQSDVMKVCSIDTTGCVRYRKATGFWSLQFTVDNTNNRIKDGTIFVGVEIHQEVGPKTLQLTELELNGRKLVLGTLKRIAIKVLLIQSWSLNHPGNLRFGVDCQRWTKKLSISRPLLIGGRNRPYWEAQSTLLSGKTVRLAG